MDRYIFVGLCVLVFIAEIITTYKLVRLHKKGFPTILMHYSLVATSTAMAGYVISILSTSYFVMSLFSSIYFCSIDITLLCVVELIVKITDTQLHKAGRLLRRVCITYGFLDMVILMINPFHEIALYYTADPRTPGHWLYEPMLLYNMHLIFCYILILEVCIFLMLKMRKTPALYHSRYALIAEGIMLIVVLNCFFLYPDVHIRFTYDVSVLFYGGMLMLVYYNSVYYADKKLLKEAHSQLMMELNNPVLLFDYEKKLVSCNHAAREFFKEDPERMTIEEFIQDFNLEDSLKDLNRTTSFQWIYKKNIYICNYQTLVRKGEAVGYVFNFNEVSTEIDFLTGFHTNSAIIRDFLNEGPELPSGVLVCDPAGLIHVNEKYGRTVGDAMIHEMAALMRACCPENSYFGRIHDATLLAVCPGASSQQMKKIMQELMAKVADKQVYSQNMYMISAFSMCTPSQPSLRGAITSAENTINLKKMMDAHSSHSYLMSSFAAILQEADPQSKDHVIRTRMLGAKMAEKLQLSDETATNLALLCLLHDVGMVCIPAEIRNKTTALTYQEQELMRSHVQKGYQIAKASRELEPLADLILHHHERWDGTGYPGRLKKEEIPMLCNLLSVIDAYDSMTHEQPYHKAVSRHKALTELTRCAGSQFDPYLVIEFAEMIRQDPEYLNEVIDLEETISDTDTDRINEADPLAEEPAYMAPVVFSRYILSDVGDRILSADENFEYLTGYTQEEARTGNLFQSTLIFPEDREDYEKLKNKLMQTEKEAFIEHRIRMKDGACRYVFCHGNPMYDPVLKVTRIQIIITDLSESVTVKNIIENEKQIASHTQEMLKGKVRQDSLTGLLNHIAFRNDLQGALLMDNRICVMLMCDLDHFKNYNDTMGHTQGDELLKDFARVLSDVVSADGTTCRMGGDEFAIALYYPKETVKAEIVNDVKERYRLIQENLQSLTGDVSVSMGMAMSIGDEKNFDRMYTEADRALYEAKNQGRHRLVTI